MTRIGIISDTHDNIVNTRRAVDCFNSLKLDRVVHLGDVVARFTLAELRRLQVPVWVLLGNCDGDRASLIELGRESGFEVETGPIEFVVGGRRIWAAHLPPQVQPDCDIILHGHTHHRCCESGPPLVVNPGEACGWLTGCATCAVLEVETGKVTFFDL